MKCRILLIAGGIIVAGVVAYEVYRHRNNHNNEFVTRSNPENSMSLTSKKIPADKTPKDTTTDIGVVREAVASSLRDRHREAAKVMQESLNTIFANSEGENIVTENDEALAQTESDLCDLLK